MVTVVDKPITPKELESLYTGLKGQISSKAYLENLVAMQRFWTYKTLKEAISAPVFEDASERTFDTSLVSHTKFSIQKL